MNPLSYIIKRTRERFAYLRVLEELTLGREPIETPSGSLQVMADQSSITTAPVIEELAGGNFYDTTVDYAFVWFDPATSQAIDLDASASITFGSDGASARITGMPGVPAGYGNLRLWLARYDQVNVGAWQLLADVSGQTEYTDDNSAYYDYWPGPSTGSAQYAIGFETSDQTSAVGAASSFSVYAGATATASNFPAAPAGATRWLLRYSDNNSNWYAIADITGVDDYQDATADGEGFVWSPDVAVLQTVTPGSIPTTLNNSPAVNGNFTVTAAGIGAAAASHTHNSADGSNAGFLSAAFWTLLNKLFGTSNTLGSTGVVIGGQSNTASGSRSFIGGGQSMTASGANSAMLACATGTVSGAQAFAAANAGATVNRPFSAVIGGITAAVAPWDGAVCLANINRGGIASFCGMLGLNTPTVNASSSGNLFDGAQADIPFQTFNANVPAVAFDIAITCRATTGSHAGWAVLRRNISFRILSTGITGLDVQTVGTDVSGGTLTMPTVTVSAVGTNNQSLRINIANGDSTTAIRVQGYAKVSMSG